MATTVDHLANEQWVRVRRSFVDAAGNRFEEGEIGWIRFIHFDRVSFGIRIEIEQGEVVRNLVLFDSRQTGDLPRSGRMKEFLEVTGREYRAEPKAAAIYVEDLSNEPAWYRDAVALEKQDRLSEAEECIRTAIPHASYAFKVSDLYRARMLRLRSVGDEAGAEMAGEMALGAAYGYASMATSGGEGTAMLREAKEFISLRGLEKISATTREYIEGIAAEARAQRGSEVVDSGWVQRYQALELEGRLEEAEACILEGVPHIGAGISIANMYRNRWLRLRAAGDEAGAEHARQKASAWAYTYASWATSGGEGAALSLERNEFLKTLEDGAGEN